ncbi:MAG: hypothetical protein QM729_21460 [Solirubrobacterales bacterium]
MAAWNEPLNGGQLIQQGFTDLGGAMQQKLDYDREQERLNAPGDAAFDQFINRVLAGEDPNRVAEEARRNPQIAQLLQQRLGSQGAQPVQTSQPGVNWQQSGVPLGSGPSAQMPQQAPASQPAPQQSLGSMAAQPYRAPPVSNELQGAPGAGAGMPSPSMQQYPAPNSLPPANYTAQGPNGASVQVSRPGPEQAPASAPQPAPQEVRRTVRQQQPYWAALPTMVAQQGQNQRADGKNDAANYKAELTAMVGLLREKGLDERQQQQVLAQFAGYDSKERQAFYNGLNSLESARIRADATRDAAAMGASASRYRTDVTAETAANKPQGSGESSAEKELRSLINANASIVGKPEWTKDADATAQFQANNARIQELQSAVGRPVGQTKPGTSRPAPAPSGSSEPNVKTKVSVSRTQSTKQPSKTIRVKLKSNGKTGQIPESSFDPKTMERI